MPEIYVMYGNQPEKMAEAVLMEMNIEEDLKRLGKKQPLIVIKPNLVVAQPAEWGATTSPDLVRGVIRYLRNLGLENLVVMESSWIGDSTQKAYQVCGYEDISREFNVPLVDLKKDTSQEFEVQGMMIRICREVLKADYLINMPVLKAHCQTKMTCALKNLKGCLPDSEKRRFHTLGLHHPIACLNKILTSHLTIVDGLIGDLTHEEGGNPVRMNRVIAGRDPVLIDAYIAELLGYSVQDIQYIGLAEKMGIGTANLISANLKELNRNDEEPIFDKIQAGREVDFLQQWVNEDKACSACYGSLIHALMRLKEKGKLTELPKSIHIGQGFKGNLAEVEGLGIGQCTVKFDANVPGCPPSAAKILRYLEDWLEKQ